MKKIVASSLALAFASTAFAADNIDLYGRVQQEVTKSYGTEGGGSFTIQDAQSRLGIRGSEDLGGGIKAVFAYEFGVDTDATSNAPLNTRHAYVGMKSAKYGMVVVGSQDGGNDSQAPLYKQARDTLGGVNNNSGSLLLVGAPGNASLKAPIERQQRTGNALGYALNIGDYSISARHSQLGTNDAGNNTVNPTRFKENGVRNTEVAVAWNRGPLMIGGGMGYTDRQEIQKPNQFNEFSTLKSTYQAVASYDFGIVKISGLAAQNNFEGKSPFSDENSNREYSVSALAPLTGNSGVFFNVSDSERNNLIAAEDLRQYQVAYYYDFSRRTRGYTGFNLAKTDVTSPFAPDSSTYDRTYTVGLMHNF